MRLGPVIVIAPDLGQALGFYRDRLALGLRAEHPGHLIFDLPPGELHVFAGSAAAAPHRHGRDAATVLTFEVADIEQAMGRLAGRGVVFLHETPAWNAAASLRYAAFEAPGGLVHELVQRVRAAI
jgi:catechol 2,3-dioxygenase-like lactoylglutathione lyase family enzyme